MLIVKPLLALSSSASQVCSSSVLSSSDCTQSTLNGSIGNIASVLLTVAGAIAVLIIIFGGIMYVTSTGDSARIKQAKDTVLYAIIGLIVAILAYAIVHYVASTIH